MSGVRLLRQIRKKLGVRMLCLNIAVRFMPSLCVMLLTGFIAHSSAAPIMTGGPYAITSDVVLAGQGVMTGATYRVDATIGESAGTLPNTAGVFRVYSGFWQGERFVPLCLLDIDGNGVIDAATDGVLIARAMAGFTGPALVADALGVNATVSLPEQILRRINIEALDADGSGDISMFNDGLILLRAMSGVAGSAALEGVVSATATRTTWAQVRTYLNTRCSASFAP